VDRPSVAGFFHPRILIPPTLVASLSAAELAQIATHELEHLRRADDWTNLLQKLSLVALPLNPVLLWLERRLAIERELACDDRVVRATGTPKAYAACLTHLAERSMIARALRRGGALALGAWERQSELGRRVHRILRRRVTPMPVWQSRAITATLVCGLVAGAGALAHSPRLISFLPSPSEAPQTASLRGVRVEDSSIPAPAVRTTAIQATAVPVKAILPAPQTRRAFDQSQAMRMYRTVHRSAIRRARAQTPGLTLTSAGNSRGATTAQPSRVTLTVFEFSQPSYAAVRTADGWLILQL
jgi:hypothetical protein